MPHLFRYIPSLALIAVSACSRIPPADDGCVSQLVEERLDKQVQWYQGDCADEQVLAAIRYLLEQELTSDSAVQIALLNNPELQAAFEELGIAHADLIEAGLFHNPLFEGFIRFPNEPGLKLNTEFAISQNFLDLFLIPLRQKIAEAEFEQAKYRAAQAILDLAFDVQESFFMLAGEQSRQAFLETLVEAGEASAALAEAQLRQGNINELEAQRSRHEYLEAKITYAQSQSERIRLRQKLNKLMGLASSDSCWKLSEKLSGLAKDEPDMACLESLALEDRLDLEVARWEVCRLGRMLDIKQWWAYTDLGLGISYEREAEGFTETGPALAGAIPIFNNGQADRARLRSLYRQSLDRLSALEIDVAAQVRSAYGQLNVNRDLVRAFQQKLLPLQRQMLALSQRYYNTMSLSVYKLLRVKTQELQTRIHYIEHLKNYWVARVELDRAIGGGLKAPAEEDLLPDLAEDRVVKPSFSVIDAPAEFANARRFIPFTNSNPVAYNPVITPNGSTLPWTMEDGVKVFRLTAEPVKREFAPGLVVNCWGYNGQTPGPTIEVVEGDRVRILVTNQLPEPTTVHWHGILLPNGMDGVTGLNQKPIPPGETFQYEFTIRQRNGTHMYHPHYDEMTQLAMGMMGFFIIHPKDPSEEEKVDRDFAIMLMGWAVPIGAAAPDPMVMTDFNYFTFNSRVWPGTEPLVAKTGEKVRIRFGNLSMDSHPIHLHGYQFDVIAYGAERLNPSAQYSAVTINVPVGDTRDIQFVADAPGDWAMHCHKSHHTMNGMEHDIPNLIGVDQKEIQKKIKKLLPHYMAMGSAGMGEMFEMGHHMHGRGPPNYLGLGSPGPHGIIEMSGMFTVLKVRDGLVNYNDPGWYHQPPGTTVERVE